MQHHNFNVTLVGNILIFGGMLDYTFGWSFSKMSAQKLLRIASWRWSVSWYLSRFLHSWRNFSPAERTNVEVPLATYGGNKEVNP